MTMDAAAMSVPAILQRVELFSGLGEDDLAAVAALARERSFPRNAAIWQQGELGTTFYIILEGRVGALVVDENGLEQLSRVLGRGDTFGETSLLTGETREATMIAVTACRLLCISREEFQELLESRHSLEQRLRMREEVRQKYYAPHFAWLDPGEVPSLFLHRHLVWLLPRLALPFSLCFVGALLFAVAAGVASGVWLELGGLALFVAGLAGLFWYVLDWRNDFFMVTNRRVIEMEKVLLFSEERTEAALHQIQDVRVVMEGVIQRMLGVGNVRVETAGAAGQVGFTYVTDPDMVKETIFAQMRRFLAMQRASERAQIRRELRRRMGQDEEAAPETPQPPSRRGRAPGPTRTRRQDSALRAAVGYLLPRFREEHGEIVTWRKHWSILLAKVAGPVLLVAVALALSVAFAGNGPFWVLPMLLAGLGLFLWWYQYEDWRNDIYQVSGGRLVDMTRRPLLGKVVRKEGELGRIQNIAYKMDGAVQNFLMVGDVLIETAGQTSKFEFRGVYKPREVANEIWRRLARQQKREQQLALQRQGDLVGDWFEEYGRLLKEREGGVPKTL
ncbi:MAG: cyclic nucleotide-binding domain-containing protein [Chloroflexi bacterium]|nr:cyclic nucleotide-binding domain-containing protein [Chloroflexota bacterium]